MTIRVVLNHRTHYRFDRKVQLSPHTVRLRPAPHCRTPIISYSLDVTPDVHFLNWQQDPFGNYLARLVFPKKSDELIIDIELIADLIVINPFDFFLDDTARTMPITYNEQLKKELFPYLERLALTPYFSDYLATINRNNVGTNDFLVSVNQQLQQHIRYTTRLEPGIQTPEQTLEKGSGSCRDSAWLLIQLLRHLGLAARFTSGYLVQLKADQPALDGPSGTAEDFTDLHAWCEVYLPGAGWAGLDPTSGLFASEGHIPLACTPSPISAAPITGNVDDCQVSLNFSNTVKRLHEDPRVTKPYNESTWKNILSLGDHVDEQLASQDVRLTMGGEPTFISIDDMESAQWNTEALGDDKLTRANDLLLRLKQRFAPQGLLYYGQGKWYPEELLPRWAIGIIWRKDGHPLWQDSGLLALTEKDYGLRHETAQTFIESLAIQLGLSVDYCRPAYEDEFFYLQQAQKIPLDDDLNDDKDNGDHDDLNIKLQQGFENPAGYVLPLQWHTEQKGWQSCHWHLRKPDIQLTPGASPMGFRLPLDELPHSEDDDMIPHEPDTFASHDELPVFTLNDFPRPSLALSSNKAFIRTTLCVESREGKLFVFLPPLNDINHYLELIAAIEITASTLSTPIIIEGYAPPRDTRLCQLMITPDPGVIEVNIHPLSQWREMVETQTLLYEEARHARLATEKFMLDGRHTGTGGGNHITLGAANPVDSPILRRPDLLRSLITYWQHHPSLSYLFSGLFIGPTSQAPRVDEGRDDILYELELAFSQVSVGETVKPWLVDRIFRNLLIDVTGNTHRAEFCIDKLYSPSGPAGRLGILELRGFEMPPHHQMALVQTLLIRCLISRFWAQPYQKPLVRWGTTLHDKFMLPHFIWQDMKTVIADINAHNLSFDINWLLPFEAFRFPHYGRLNIEGIQLELRWAIEPWHVLGEELGLTGTSRYVDSSVERLQIKVTGLTHSRYIIACNGRYVPMTKTDRQGEQVAGIRYKAWQPPSALHPNLGVNTPLRFDVIDTWNNQVIGGCTYHVSHPGGRTYDTFPVNAFEAEARRSNRFDTLNHHQGSSSEAFNHPPNKRLLIPHKDIPFFMIPPKKEPDNDYPHTLDLRQPLTKSPIVK